MRLIFSKNIIFSVFLSVLALPIFGQRSNLADYGNKWTLSFVGGYNAFLQDQHYTLGDTAGRYFTNEIDFQVGVKFSFMFLPQLTIVSGLFYAPRNIQVNYYCKTCVDFERRDEQVYHLQHLEIPVLLRTNIGSGRFDFATSAGVGFNFLLDGNRTVLDDQLQPQIVPLEGGMKQVLTMVVAGSDVSYALNEIAVVSLAVFYRSAIDNLYENQFYRYRNFSAEVGLNFTF